MGILASVGQLHPVLLTGLDVDSIRAEEVIADRERDGREAPFRFAGPGRKRHDQRCERGDGNYGRAQREEPALRPRAMDGAPLLVALQPVLPFDLLSGGHPERVGQAAVLLRCRVFSGSVSSIRNLISLVSRRYPHCMHFTAQRVPSFNSRRLLPRQRGQGLSKRRSIFGLLSGRCGRRSPIRDHEVADLFGEFSNATAFQNAAGDARFAKGALVAVWEVASVSNYTGAGAKAAKPAVGLGAGRSGSPKVGDDHVRLELVR